MARQKGIIKIDGTLGDITFMKTRDGYIAKEKTHISAERIASDGAFLVPAVSLSAGTVHREDAVLNRKHPSAAHVFNKVVTFLILFSVLLIAL